MAKDTNRWMQHLEVQAEYAEAKRSARRRAEKKKIEEKVIDIPTCPSCGEYKCICKEIDEVLEKRKRWSR